MITTNDLRSGMTIVEDGVLYQVIEAEHVKQGRGSAFVRVKLRNVETGATINRTMRAGEKVEQARLIKREMQYLYNDGANYHFMDNETFDQVALEQDAIGDAIKFLKENMTVTALLHNGNVISIVLPNTVEVTVVETEPGIRGDSVSAAFKPAKVDTGATVQVPLFVNVGDVIQVDTRSGEYLSRV